MHTIFHSLYACVYVRARKRRERERERESASKTDLNRAITWNLCGNCYLRETTRMYTSIRASGECTDILDLVPVCAKRLCRVVSYVTERSLKMCASVSFKQGSSCSWLV